MNKKRPVGKKLDAKLIEMVSGGIYQDPDPYQKVVDPLPTPDPDPDPLPDPYPTPDPYFKILPFVKRI